MAQSTVTETGGLTHTDVVTTYNGNATDAESRIAALEASPSRLTIVAGTDAAVTMLVNRHYELDGSILTADRIYELPSATVGDRIRVSLTNGNASYELILQGDTSITINGGTAATEWSRLFIARECVEFRATSTTNWDVLDDGRIPMYGYLYAAASSSVSSGTWSTIAYDNSYTNCNNTDEANEYIVARRKCRARGRLRWFSGTLLGQTILAIVKNGFSVSGPNNRVDLGSFAPSSGLANLSGGNFPWEIEDQLQAGDFIGSMVINNGAMTATTDSWTRPMLTFEEILV